MPTALCCWNSTPNKRIDNESPTYFELTLHPDWIYAACRPMNIYIIILWSRQQNKCG
jgi:hypothetical protein